MKFVLISDTHCQHDNILLPEGDVLIHAGDSTHRGREYEIEEFAHWMKQQNFEHKIFIPGNHDWMFQRNEAEARRLMGDSCTVLIDQEYIIPYKELDESGNTVNKEIKIWGSPWQPAFYNWAFNLDTREELRDKWKEIPNDADIVVTHGPPFDMLDMCRDGKKAGCKDLWFRLMDVKPKLHVFGHIHEGSGQKRFLDVDFVNASQLNEHYQKTNKPIEWYWE